MEPFADDRSELTGSLISLEFGVGGRITQLWATDPALPEEGEDFQFILPPLAFGEESAEDYFPGTIMLGVRTNPKDPWVLDRNNNANLLDPYENDPEGMLSNKVSFEYEFSLIPEIEAKGHFYEVSGPIPQIVWDVEIINRGRKTIEIGELGFPIALNSFYDGFGWSDDQLRQLWTSRLYIHKFIGGAASWVFAQRMTSEPPGLLVFPGDTTAWEFFASVPSSLNTPHQWEGIPVVYVYSRAAAEREGWLPGAYEHTSLILEPGDRKTFQMRFVPADRDKQDGIFPTLASLGRPAIRVLPSAVAPMDVGIAVEIGGATPIQFYATKDALVDTDSDEEGGFCFVRPKEPGPVRLTFQDSEGRVSYCHLLFTDPIETLIKRRSTYILENQVIRDQTSPLFKAICLANTDTNEPITTREEFSGASGIECSLADALFLAEKNTLYPDRAEIKVLDEYIEGFLLERVQNPGDFSVGSTLGENFAVGSYAGRPLTYPAVFNLYHAMHRISATYGETMHKPRVYLKRAALTCSAMFRFGWRHYVRTVGLLGYSRIYDILKDLNREGLKDEAEKLSELIEFKANEMTKLQFPYAGESVLDTSGFEEVFNAARYLNNDEHLERTMRCAHAARSLAPSWWWYGSDKRSWDGADSTPLDALIDRGEACLAHTTIPNSLMFFESMDRDYLAISDAYLRLSFGGMMGPWALIRNDGAVSMCYCPDRSSKHFGYNSFTGASGLGYTHYLINAGAYVLPNRNQNVFAFGCHFTHEDGKIIVRPWDGVGRRVVLRQIGAEFELTFGKIEQVILDERKRWAELKIHNPADKEIKAELMVRGMWGQIISIAGRNVESKEGDAVGMISLPARQTSTIQVKVVR